MFSHKTVWKIGLTVLLLGATALPIAAQKSAQSCEKVGDGFLVGVVPPERIPPINQAKFVSAKEAERFMKADEPVLGIFDGQVAKAYSLWQLDRHEVVNDETPTLGPIAVTW